MTPRDVMVLRRSLWAKPARTRIKALVATLLPLVLLVPAIFWVGGFGYPGVTSAFGSGIDTVGALLAMFAAAPLDVLAHGTQGLLSALASQSAPAMGLVAVTLGAVLASLYGATGERLGRRAIARTPRAPRLNSTSISRSAGSPPATSSRSRGSRRRSRRSTRTSIRWSYSDRP